MKRSDIKVGEEYAYAAYPGGKRENLRCNKVTVLGFEKMEKRRRSWMEPTVTTQVKVLFNHANQPELLPSSRNIVMPWAEYEEIAHAREQAGIAKDQAFELAEAKAEQIAKLLLDVPENFLPSVVGNVNRASVPYITINLVGKDIEPFLVFLNRVVR